MTLPVLDLSKSLLGDASEKNEVVHLLKQAAISSGFFYIKNHGIDSNIIDRQFNIAKDFFDLNFEEKNQFNHQNNFGHRGYEAFKGQKLDITANPDLKEGFYCGRNYAKDHPYVVAGYQNYGLNQWPNQYVEGFEQSSLEYIEAMVKLSKHIMQLLALSLDLDEHYFDAAFQDPMLTLRLIRYPSHPENADQKTFGAGAHTDWGALTILAQDQLGGLEVCMPDGTWIDASPIADTFVVNLGDMIPRWTNGHYHSNPHRVRNRFSQGKPRYSVPFFYEPDYTAEITPVPGTVAVGEVAKVKSCTAGQHLEEMYQRSYNLKTSAAS